MDMNFIAAIEFPGFFFRLRFFFGNLFFRDDLPVRFFRSISTLFRVFMFLYTAEVYFFFRRIRRKFFFCNNFVRFGFLKVGYFRFSYLRFAYLRFAYLGFAYLRLSRLRFGCFRFGRFRRGFFTVLFRYHVDNLFGFRSGFVFFFVFRHVRIFIHHHIRDRYFFIININRQFLCTNADRQQGPCHHRHRQDKTDCTQ